MKKLDKKSIAIIAGIGIILLTIVLFFILPKDKENQNSNQVNNEIDENPIEEVEKKVTIVDADSNKRPFAVMINNLNEARQIQSGLDKAYIVYEIIVEGGITRFLALYQNPQDLTLGSVRSARHYYLDYVLENDAVFVHWGYSQQAKNDIKTLKINNINGLTYEGVYFYRDNPLKLSSEHTGFTNADLLNKAMEKLKYRQDTDKGLLLNYSAESVNLELHGDSSEATTVTMRYSNYIKNMYSYDENTKLYKRYVNNNEHKDYVTKQQITAKNILVYEVNNYTISGDTAGRQFLENIGSGTGYYITEGKAVKMQWSKKDRASKTIYEYEDGTEISFNDGNTFIQIMPKTGKLVIE